MYFQAKRTTNSFPEELFYYFKVTIDDQVMILDPNYNYFRAPKEGFRELRNMLSLAGVETVEIVLEEIRKVLVWNIATCEVEGILDMGE